MILNSSYDLDEIDIQKEIINLGKNHKWFYYEIMIVNANYVIDIRSNDMKYKIENTRGNL